MRKYLPYIFLIIIVIVLFVIMLFNKNEEEDKYIYYYNSYNLTSKIESDDYLDVEIYVSNKKSYFVDENQINNCYLQNEDSLIDLEIVKIINNNEEVKYLNKTFYKYYFKFKLLFNTSSVINWNIINVNLYINYNNNKQYILNIGDLTINKIQDNNQFISLTNIKPLTSQISNNTYLTGLIIGIRKTTNDNIILNKIKILDTNASVGNKIEVLSNLPQTNAFSDVATFDYNSIVKGIEDVGKIINEDPIYLFIPIYYNTLSISNNFPILFELNINGNIENYYLSDYIYYEPTNVIINEKDLIIRDIND